MISGNITYPVGEDVEIKVFKVEPCKTKIYYEMIMPTIKNFIVILGWNLLISEKVSFLSHSLFSVFVSKENFTVK